MRKAFVCIAAGMALSLAGAGVALAAGVEGLWRTEHGWQVKIYKCGASWCGKVMGGTTMKDVHNPNPALRKRSVVGIDIIRGMRKQGKRFKGRLYNPKDGNTYTGYIEPLSASKPKLSGCVLGGLICKGQTWTRIR